MKHSATALSPRPRVAGVVDLVEDHQHVGFSVTAR